MYLIKCLSVKIRILIHLLFKIALLISLIKIKEIHLIVIMLLIFILFNIYFNFYMERVG